MMEKYLCESCDSIFETNWTDEEAMTEFHKEFPMDKNVAKEDLATICDDCYQNFMKWYRSIYQ